MTTVTNTNFHKGHGKKIDSLLFLILLKGNLGLHFNFLRMLAREVTLYCVTGKQIEPITSRGFSSQTGIVDTLILFLTSPDHPGSPSIANVMPCPFPRVHRESFYEETEDIDGS